jgi:hypothetical protein
VVLVITSVVILHPGRLNGDPAEYVSMKADSDPYGLPLIAIRMESNLRDQLTRITNDPYAAQNLVQDVYLQL